ncbi:uncharacterized protein LOC100182338 [Ciona intestinalis]
MKYLGLLVVIYTLMVQESDQILWNTGNFEFFSYSPKASTEAEIPYMSCQTAAPLYVSATAKPTDPSLPYKFNLTILKVSLTSFVVKLERIDDSTGWYVSLNVAWSAFTRRPFIFRNTVIWLRDFSYAVAMQRQVAQHQCNEVGGKLVDISDKEMYDAVYNYVEKNFIFGNREDIWIWLGSNYDHEVMNTGMVVQSNGEAGYNGSWVVGYPNKKHYWHGLLVLIVSPGRNKTLSGMRNRSSKFYSCGNTNCTSLCAMKLL